MKKDISHQDTKTRRKEEILRFSREDTRRYAKKTVPCRGLIHQTRKVAGLDKSSPYKEQGTCNHAFMHPCIQPIRVNSCNPSARGAYMLRKFVCVGFHSFLGEGAASCETAIKMIHETHEKHEKNKKNQCNLCNLWLKKQQG